MGTKIEEYKKYMKKCELTGNEVFKFTVSERYGVVRIDKYIENKEPFRKIEIPGFVNAIRLRAFLGVKQSLRIVNKNNKIKNMDEIFTGYQGEELDLSQFNTAGAFSMKGMFMHCRNIKRLDLGSFDTSKVSNMSTMFSECVNLKELSIKSFDTHKVIDMSWMFSKCMSLKELRLNNFNTEQVENMKRMFSYCISLDYIDLSSFRIRQETKTDGIFEGCKQKMYMIEQGDIIV